DEAGLAAAQALFGELEAQGMRSLSAQGFPTERCVLERDVRVRYRGQQWDIRVEVDAGSTVATVLAQFEESYEQLYGHIQPDGRIEICGVHLVALGKLDVISPKPVGKGAAFEPVSHR